MEKLKLKLAVYEQALASFRDLIQADIRDLDKILNDGIKNGRIQKFEYTIELTWKLVKRFLYDIDGVETKSPKEAIKEFFLKGHASEEAYQQLMQMIDDRNSLSHIYDQDDFDEIHDKLDGYLLEMEKVLGHIKSKIS